MAGTQEESEEDDKEESDDKNYQGTSKGVTGERNSTSHKVIFVDNLPSTMDKNGFIDLFRSYGVIVDFKFLKHKTGAETGYGFVEFGDWEDGRKAIHELNWKLIEQRNIRVSRAKPPTKRVSMTNLYVENVPKSWNDETITAYFSRICEITHARILVNRKNGQSRGVGFVHCYSNDHAKAAIQYVNVENRGKEGGLNLFVKFAKISRAERKIQRQRSGHGNQERRKWLSRDFKASDNYKEQSWMRTDHASGIVTQDDRSSQRGGNSHYGQRQHRSAGRNSKFNRKKSIRRKYDKRPPRVLTNGGQYNESNREMDIKQSFDQNRYLPMSSPNHFIPMQPNASGLAQLPHHGMMTPAFQQTSYLGEQQMISTAIPSKLNHVNPVIQIPFRRMIPQMMHSKDIEAGCWKSDRRMQPGIKPKNWLDEKNAERVAATDAISNGVAGKLFYPSNPCINTAGSSHQSVRPYAWSPMVTPVVGTPVGVASPFFANLVGSPILGSPPNAIPIDLHSNTNHMASPQISGNLPPHGSGVLPPQTPGIIPRQSPGVLPPQTPGILSCSNVQSPNSTVQPNAMYWPISPLTVTHSLATPFTLQQQMPNLSLNDNASRNWRLEEKEPATVNNTFPLPAYGSEATSTPKHTTLRNRPGGGVGTFIETPAKERSGNYNKGGQFVRRGKQLVEEMSQASSPMGQGQLSRQKSWSGLQSYFTTQNISIDPSANQIAIEASPVTRLPR